MLYKELVRVSELDKQIADLHHNLTELYAERSAIIKNRPAQTIKTTKQNQASGSALAVYNNLSLTWQELEVALPPYAVLQKKLKRIMTLKTQLEADNNSLNGKMYVVAVPPFTTLEKAMKTADQTNNRHFHVADETIFQKIRKSKVWSLVLVFDGMFDQPVGNLKKSEDFFYQTHDCLALGVQELIAAELQGVNISSENGWTLLLKDSWDGKYIPSSTVQNGNVVIDIDDAGGLLGSNYIRPAVKAA
jgi:hypothetical protein